MPVQPTPNYSGAGAGHTKCANCMGTFPNEFFATHQCDAMYMGRRTAGINPPVEPAPKYIACGKCGWRLGDSPMHGDQHDCRLLTLDDGTKMSREEHRLRSMLGSAVGKDLYRDDGECSEGCHLGIDYMRMQPTQIDAALQVRAQARWKSGDLSQPHKVNTMEYGPGLLHHDMPCPVHTDQSAVHCEGIFHPSWKAHNEGWRLVQARTRAQRWVLKLFFGELL